jgi:two-component system, LytTR family, response regulator
MKTPIAIIENDNSARDSLANLLIKNCPSVEVDWSFPSLEGLLNLEQEILPQIVFVNPCMKDLEALKGLPRKGHDPEYIAIIGNDQPKVFPMCYLNPIGYLYWPIDEELLILTIENAKRIIALKRTKALTSLKRQVAIPTSDGLDFLSSDEIIRCESLTNCTKIITAPSRKNIISSYNIGEFKKLLEESGFYCPHKSHLINLLHIDKYKREGIIIMRGDEKAAIPVSRNKRPEFLNLITRL